MRTGRKVFTLFVAIMALCLTALSPAIAEDITINHKSGTTEVPFKPKRVVVFDLATLDNLNRLGVKDIVGVPEARVIPSYIKQYQSDKYEKVGTLFEPDYEAVAALAPDLIIVGGRSQPKQKELSKIAPTIDMTVNNNNFLKDVEENVATLGKIFEKEKEAKAEDKSLSQAVAHLKTKSAKAGTGLIILTTGGKMSAFGPGSRFGLIYKDFGVQPADANISVGKHGQPISPEFLLSTNPDWLFVVDRDVAIGNDGESAQQILDNPIVNKTTAAKEKQIVYLNPQNWYLVGGGLSGLHNTIDQLDKVYDHKH